MLRLTRELVTQGLDSRQELCDLLMQINLMEAHATLQGMEIDTDLAQKLAQLANQVRPQDQHKPGNELKATDDASVLKALELAFEVHGSLCKLIHPVTPETLEASVPRKGWARIIWPRVTDMLIMTTFAAIVIFAVGQFYKNRFPELHMEQLAFLGAALLGASFSGLYRSYDYVQKRVFDPAAGSSYMVRVVLGTVSGLILANIGDLLILKATGSPTTGTAAASTNPLLTIGPGSLALIGGYSADAVNLILQRIADTLVTTVRGSADDSVKAKQAQLEADSKTADFQQRQATVSALTELLKNATDDTTKNNIQLLMAAVGQGNVTGDLLKTSHSNGKPPLNLAALGGAIKTDATTVSDPAVLQPASRGATSDAADAAVAGAADKKGVGSDVNGG